MEAAEIKDTTPAIITQLKEKFGEVITGSAFTYNMPEVTIKRESNIEVVKYLMDNGYKFLTDLTGVHFPDNKGAEIGVVYHLHDMPKNVRVRVKAFMPVGDATIQSLTSLFPGANWMERETYDFFGINFKGHPDLKRILNMDEMNYFPMRKEYPLEDGSRSDKSDKMFGR